jgi:polyisoprenoid-binding protein YceI
MKWAIAAAVVAVLALVGGPFVYINFIKEDAPERFALDEPIDETTAPTTAPTVASTADPPVDTDVATTPAVGGAEESPSTAAADGVDGTWTIGAGSAVGYRVVEVLFGQDAEGVGRTDQVTGQITITGAQVSTGSFEVAMGTVVSDEERRDNQFRGRLLDTATFTLTTPIELGGVPADGTPVTATATGELTLRGVTRPVTFEVQAQRSGASIQVVGSTDIVFADYGIPQPDAPGITTQDHGLLEFDLHLSQA